MKIAVMGAGGIGGYVGGRLAEAGHSVHLIARGRHLEAMRLNGLRIECPLGDVTLPAIHATDDPAEIGPVDVVVFTVKLGATDVAARALAPLIQGCTRIVTLQNGIDGNSMISRHVDRRHVAAGCTYLTAHIREPGVIHAPGGSHRILVDGLAGDETIAGFLQACVQAIGLEATGTDDIAKVLWEKFVRLVAFSGATCLTRKPIGAILAHPESLNFLQALLRENLAVAAAVGQGLPADAAEVAMAFFRALPTEAKSSMLVDLEAGRPLEMPWLAGRMSELARSHGVPAPANTAVVAALVPHAAGANSAPPFDR